MGARRINLPSPLQFVPLIEALRVQALPHDAQMLTLVKSRRLDYHARIWGATMLKQLVRPR